MMTIGQHLVAAIGATVAALAAVIVATPLDGAFAGTAKSLVDVYADANGALLRGDSGKWNKLMPLGEDFVLFSPFGGTPSRYADYTPERIERMGKFFKNGTFKQEVVQTFASEDMIVLATIERASVEVGGLPPQDWALRVTSVFRRDGKQWKLVHRHADPLVGDVSITESARLARGERAVVSK